MSRTSEPVPLTFGQEQLHDIAEVLGGESVIIPMAVSLPVVNIGALKAALTSIVHRHDALRMMILNRDGVLRQVVRHGRSVEVLPHSALGSYGLGPTAGTASGPLLVAVQRSGPAPLATIYLDHRLIDGWGAALVVAQLMERYESILRGGSRDGLAVPAPSFAAYAAAQRAVVDDRAIERHLAFWSGELAGGEPMELPLVVRPWTAGVRLGERPALDFVLEGCPVNRLATAAGSAGSVAAVVLAALALATRAATGQTDLLFETMMSDRAAPAKRRIVGCLVNSVPLRVRCPDPEPGAVVRSCVRTLAGAARHQIGPFHRVGRHEAGNLLNRTPRFRIAFNHDLGSVRPVGAETDYPRRRLAEPFRRAGRCAIAETRVRSVSDLFVEVLAVPAGSPLRLRFAYRPDLWNRDGVEEFGLAVAHQLYRMAGVDMGVPGALPA